MTTRLLYFILPFLFTGSLSAQESQLTGLWEITNVQVGEEEMTPVAKWTRIHADGTYESGNGWLQNAVGTWTFHPENREFLPVQTNGLEDPFGPFLVSFSETGMEWKREEEGMQVIVSLARISKLPMSPADELTGLWGQTDSPEFLFFRWDRIYVARDENGNRSTGYWHIHGHRPDITLLPHAEGKPAESWRISFDENGQLQMTGLSETNMEQVRTFNRLANFPE